MTGHVRRVRGSGTGRTRTHPLGVSGLSALMTALGRVQSENANTSKLTTPLGENPTMKTFHDEMLEQAAAQAAIRQAKAAKRAEAEQAEKRSKHTLRFTSMTDRVRKLIDDMPDDERLKARPMTDFTNALRGKYQKTARGRGRAHPGEVGQALRELGWSPRRNWSGRNATGVQTLWHPPQQESAA